jgi:hypothetical protein
LWHDWDDSLELDIENNEGNLAISLVSKDIPGRIEVVKGNSRRLWELTCLSLDAYRTSDQGDFWAFFYQCWSILPLSLQLKLKHISMRLTTEAPNPKKRLEVEEMRYTPVLTKQVGNV